MRALEPLKLQAVFEQTQELVGGNEIGAVVASDVPAVPQHREGLDSSLDPKRFVDPAVHHLQELNGELDIAQPTATEFDLALAHVLGQHRLDPAAHRLHVDDKVFALRGLPHHRAQRVHVLAAQFHVAGHRPRLEEGLELPRLGPALVVGDMRIEGSGESARLAFRP